MSAAQNLPAPSPDTELIQVCEQHCRNMDAYNTGAEDGPGWPIDAAPGPLWLAYDQSRNVISASKPQTLAGVVAKAMAARHEAIGSRGTQSWEGSMGEVWAPDIINDLLRVTGRAA